jgi:hypothetical protein
VAIHIGEFHDPIAVAGDVELGAGQSGLGALSRVKVGFMGKGLCTRVRQWCQRFESVFLHRESLANLTSSIRAPKICRRVAARDPSALAHARSARREKPPSHAYISEEESCRSQARKGNRS